MPDAMIKQLILLANELGKKNITVTDFYMEMGQHSDAPRLTINDEAWDIANAKTLL